METKCAAVLFLLPLLLQLAIVLAAPAVIQSTSQTCDSTKLSSYTLAIFKLRQEIVRSRPRMVCPELLTTAFPGQTISPSFCNAERTTIGKYIPIEIPADNAERANKLFEDESSGAEEPERFCSSKIRLTIRSYDVVEGADFGLYKLPSLRSNNGEIYTVTVTDRDSGETVLIKKVLSSASGWQLTDISTYAKTQSFRMKGVHYFNIYVKKSDNSHLNCQEMKTVFALDCAVAQEVNNFPFTENILPAMAVYNSGEMPDIFGSLFGKRSIKPRLDQGLHSSSTCEIVPNVVHLQNYVKKEYKVIEPVTFDRGQCVSTTTQAACPPQETSDLLVVLDSKDGTTTIENLKNFIVNKC